MPNQPASAVLPPLHVIPRRDSLRYTERFNERYLDGLRRQGDPLADVVVARLAEEGSLKNFSDLLGETRRRAEAEGGPYQQLLDACNEVPEWADFGAMRTGQRMIAAFPVHMGLSLFSGSLVGGAVFQKMSLITAMTGMLSGDSNRRLDETAAMVVRMAFPGVLEPGGEGHELLVRVRLLHAAVRRYLVDSGRFKHPSEVPINQQDLAITLALFGYLNIRSLGLMGIHFNERELSSYNLLWRYAGHVLGIVPELLPRDVREQQEFFLASLKHQGRPEKLDPATKCVMDNVAKNATRRMPALFPVVQQFLHQGCRYLSGNEYTTGMQLEDRGDDYWGLRLLRGLGRAEHLIWRYAPGGRDLLYERGARHYRRTLARMKKDADEQGTYRVRTAPSPRRHVTTAA